MAETMQEALDSMTNRDDYINAIKGLYPIDSEHEITSIIGMKILIDAITEANNRGTCKWSELPESILRIYARSCVQKEWLTLK